jgi:hypothetical protein
MKHIEIHYHLVREKTKESVVKLTYCNTKNMVINILIKGLFIDKHKYFWHLMGVTKWVTYSLLNEGFQYQLPTKSLYLF